MVLMICSKHDRFSINPLLKDIKQVNYEEYSIQLNLYKYVFEKDYGYIIENMYLVIFHPNNNPKNYNKIPVRDMQDRIEKLMKERKKKV